MSHVMSLLLVQTIRRLVRHFAALQRLEALTAYLPSLLLSFELGFIAEELTWQRHHVRKTLLTIVRNCAVNGPACRAIGACLPWMLDSLHTTRVSCPLMPCAERGMGIKY